MAAAAASRGELLQAPRLVHELAPLAVVQPLGRVVSHASASRRSRAQGLISAHFENVCRLGDP